MYNNNSHRDSRDEHVYSKKVSAGKKRTYFFDIKKTKGNDYFLVITESKKRLDGEGYERHKIYVFKEDLTKFGDGLMETINHVKTVLLPDFDFEAYNSDNTEEFNSNERHDISNKDKSSSGTEDKW